MGESWGVLVWARALSARQKSAVRQGSTLTAPQDSPTHPPHLAPHHRGLPQGLATTWLERWELIGGEELGGAGRNTHQLLMFDSFIMLRPDLKC